MMSNVLSTLTNAVKYWYLPLIFGLLFIACGIYTFCTPLETYLALSVVFSISFIVSGLFDIFFSVQNQKILQGWGWYLVSGLLTLAMGIYLLAYPQLSVAILPFVAGFTLLFRSFQLLGFSLDLKSLRVNSWGNLAILSVLGIILSFMMLSNPIFSGMSLVTVTALAFLLVGMASIALSITLKNTKDLPNKISEDLKAKIEHLKSELGKK